jgi:hypothetical protein
VGFSSLLIIRSNVDFPAPDRPMMPTICPSGISKATPSTAATDPKCLQTLSIFNPMKTSLRGFPTSLVGDMLIRLEYGCLKKSLRKGKIFPEESTGVKSAGGS